MSDEQLRRAIEARDALQARIDAYEGAVEAWEEIRQAIEQSSLGTPGAVAVRESTPEGVGKAIVLGAKYLRERDEARDQVDRLREEVKAERDISLASGCPDCGVHDGCYRVVAERDRLRAVVDDAADGAGKTLAQVLADVMDERDRLRAVVDALREHRALVARLIGEDHEPEEEIGLDEAQWASWRRITEMLDQLDVSPAMGDGEDT